MDLTPYVDKLRRELAIAASAGGDEARALAERLVSPLESATRLALLEALSAAAEEITRELAPGSVDVRLRGRDPDFVVTPPPTGPSYDDVGDSVTSPRPVGVAGAAGAAATAGGGGVTGAGGAAGADGDEGGTSRITLRVPDHLKPRIEEAAAREGVSVNSWLVRAVSAALEPPSGSRRSSRRESSETGHHYTGWVR